MNILQGRAHGCDLFFLYYRKLCTPPLNNVIVISAVLIGGEKCPPALYYRKLCTPPLNNVIVISVVLIGGEKCPPALTCKTL